MRPLGPALVLAAACSLTACDDNAHPVTLRVDHFRQACPNGAPDYCLRLIDEAGTVVPTREVAGFEHEWGYAYDVLALAWDTEGAQQYDLVEVLDRSPAAANDRFELQLSPSFVQRVARFDFDLVSGTSARCETPKVCEALAEALYQRAPFTVELSHASTRPGAFIAHSVDKALQ